MGDGNPFQLESIGPAVERLLAVQRGERVLDVACGNGVSSRRLAALGARVVATDISATFLELARAKSAGTGDRCDAVERSVFRAYRWWTIDGLATIIETIDPAHIAAPLRAAVATGDVARGFDGPYWRARATQRVLECDHGQPDSPIVAHA